MFYCCFTVNSATIQYTHNILFNAHRHVVDLIHTVGINNQHITLENTVLFSIVCGKDEGNTFTCCFILVAITSCCFFITSINKYGIRRNTLLLNYKYNLWLDQQFGER